MILNLNKSTRYALYAAMEMAQAPEGAPVTAAAVAERYRIPAAALAKVLQRLVHEGIATGARGTGGGYRLARPPSKITLLEVIEAIESTADEGPVCLLPGALPDACQSGGACRLQGIFQEIDDVARSTFASTTLATLLGSRLRGSPALR